MWSPEHGAIPEAAQRTPQDHRRRGRQAHPLRSSAKVMCSFYILKSPGKKLAKIQSHVSNALF